MHETVEKKIFWLVHSAYKHTHLSFVGMNEHILYLITEDPIQGIWLTIIPRPVLHMF